MPTPNPKMYSLQSQKNIFSHFGKPPFCFRVKNTSPRFYLRLVFQDQNPKPYNLTQWDGHIQAPPPVFSLYTDDKFRMWRT